MLWALAFFVFVVLWFWWLFLGFYPSAAAFGKEVGLREHVPDFLSRSELSS
jgi:hypothetical protein